MSDEENLLEQTNNKVETPAPTVSAENIEALTAEVDEEMEEEALPEPEEELSDEERALRIAQLKPIVEGALFAAGEALKISRIQSLFEDYERPGPNLLRATLEALKEDCQGRGFDLLEVASGWRFQVREDFAIWVNRLWEEKPQKYSRALLETIALIAYRQPITRGDIEEVRGVAVSSHIIKTLSEREWVKVVGHRDVPGRPALYATTRQFLDYFNLKSLEDLPALSELKDIDSLNANLELDERIDAALSGKLPATDLEDIDEPSSTEMASIDSDEQNEEEFEAGISADVNQDKSMSGRDDEFDSADDANDDTGNDDKI